MHCFRTWGSSSWLVLLALTGCAAPPPEPGGRVVDLTHAFDADTVYWPTAAGFELVEVAAGETERGYFYAANRFSAAEHGGTHLDAPYHFYRDGLSVDAIPAERLMGPGVRIDVSSACAEDRDYRIGVEDLESWETEHGRIPEGALVLFHTGFGTPEDIGAAVVFMASPASSWVTGQCLYVTGGM